MHSTKQSAAPTTQASVEMLHLNMLQAASILQGGAARFPYVARVLHGCLSKLQASSCLPTAGEESDEGRYMFWPANKTHAC